MTAGGRFWMICRSPVSPASKTEPRKRYDNRRDAVTTAQRLADQEDHPFVVLEATETIYPDQGFSKGLFDSE